MMTITIIIIIVGLGLGPKLAPLYFYIIAFLMGVKFLHRLLSRQTESFLKYWWNHVNSFWYFIVTLILFLVALKFDYLIQINF
jgi:hypothetical protein